jgi:cysteine desulfuration protein SufE
MDIGDIRDSFAFFDSWEDKYRFVIEIGRDLPPMDDTLKIEQNLVRGCQSQVWLTAEYNPAADTLTFAIDSDAHIVRGLIAIILAAFNNRSPAEILAFDVEALFQELELLQHLSPSRGNGLRAMVARIRGVAAERAASA